MWRKPVGLGANLKRCADTPADANRRPRLDRRAGSMRALERAEERGCRDDADLQPEPARVAADQVLRGRLRRLPRAARGQPGESVFIHAVYLINVASDDARCAASRSTSLTHALAVGDAIGAGGVIVHPGSGKGQAPGPTFKRSARRFKAALARDRARARCCSRTPPGAGFTIGRTFEELARVIEVSGGGERLGVCLDSCHLLASGYEVRERAGVQGGRRRVRRASSGSTGCRRCT